MKRKYISILILIAIILVAGCSSKYKVTEGSNLTKSDMKMFQKKFTDLNLEERTRIITMKKHMTDEEMETFKEDFKRLCVEEDREIYKSEERAGEIFEERWDYEIRKRAGELTEEEKEIDKQRKEVAEQIVKKAGEFTREVGKVQDTLNNLYKDHEKVETITMTDHNGSSKSVDIKLEVKPTKDITVGDINSLRIEITDTILEIVEAKKIKIELYIWTAHKDTYTFTSGKGWDKEVEP